MGSYPDTDIDPAGLSLILQSEERYGNFEERVFTGNSTLSLL